MINSIKDDEGMEHTEKEDIGRGAVHYFRNILSSSNPYLINLALADFDSRVTDDMNAVLRA